MNLPFWIWFSLARKLHLGKLFRTDRHGAPRTHQPPYRFGDRITLPQTYWDGGVWAVSPEPISADDPGGARSRLYVYLQERGFGPRKTLTVPRRWFPPGMGLDWRYEDLQKRFELTREAAHLVLCIEENKAYSPATLRKARQRERDRVKEALAQPGRSEVNLSLAAFELLRRVFPSPQVVRVPDEIPMYGPWPPELESIFAELGCLGESFWIPSRPPARCHAFETETRV